MKTITLRALVRGPRNVKCMTRSGNSVTITDNGRPLWIIQTAVTAVSEDDEKRRRRELEDELAHVLQETPSKISVSELILAARQ